MVVVAVVVVVQVVVEVVSGSSVVVSGIFVFGGCWLLVVCEVVT